MDIEERLWAMTEEELEDTMKQAGEAAFNSRRRLNIWRLFDAIRAACVDELKRRDAEATTAAGQG